MLSSVLIMSRCDPELIGPCQPPYYAPRGGTRRHVRCPRIAAVAFCHFVNCTTALNVLQCACENVNPQIHPRDGALYHLHRVRGAEGRRAVGHCGGGGRAAGGRHGGQLEPGACGRVRCMCISRVCMQVWGLGRRRSGWRTAWETTGARYAWTGQVYVY